MGTNPNTNIDEDPPYPSVPDLQQREILAPALLVKPDGPVLTHQLPSRTGPMSSVPLGTTLAHILGPDEKRRRTVLICDVDWLVSRASSAAGVPWYAKVPLVLESCDAVYAKVSTGTGTLSVIPEMWAD